MTSRSESIEVFFYSLDGRRIEDVLPTLLEKILSRHWKAIVRSTSESKLNAINKHLWTYKTESFLPHGAAEDGPAECQPVFLTTEDENPNQADVLILVEEASVDWSNPRLSEHRRIVIIFERNDVHSLASSRDSWKRAKEAGCAVTYWKESQSGQWERQE